MRWPLRRQETPSLPSCCACSRSPVPMRAGPASTRGRHFLLQFCANVQYIIKLVGPRELTRRK